MNGATYTEEQQQYFAQFVADRARLRPVECNGDGLCWVEYGPPAMTAVKGGTRALYCAGCGGRPVIPRPWQRGAYTR